MRTFGTEAQQPSLFRDVINGPVPFVCALRVYEGGGEGVAKLVLWQSSLNTDSNCAMEFVSESSVQTSCKN